jgi:hypothetical protein
MKNIIAVLFVLFLLPALAGAQSKKEKQVAAATEQLRKAMVDGNKAELEQLTSSLLSYGHSGGHIDDQKEFVAKLTGGGSDFVTIDLTEQTIAISGKTALVRHTLTAKTNDNNKPGEVSLKVLLIWQKKGGKWKLLARQAVKLAH